jgi:ketosteroid isomerase-like protein
MAVTVASPEGGANAHPNALLIERLYTALEARDPKAMAACYAENATFKDIAFRRNGREKIHQMWRLVCSKPVKSKIDEIVADDRKGHAHWVACYKFGRRERPVRNDTHAEFAFESGKIVEHVDHADPLAWSKQAYAGVVGEVLGRVGPLRRFGAWLKL